MKPFLLFAPAALMFAACSDAKPESEISDSPKYECIMPPPDSVHIAPVVQDTAKECFVYDHDIEHHRLNYTRIADSVYGHLTLSWEGKDGARGPFTGHFRGDTLWMIFDATIEGSNVKEERVYLRSGDKLFNGVGTLEEDAKGIMRLQHKKMVEFDKSAAMTKGPCM